jgi:hypothetical protein
MLKKTLISLIFSCLCFCVVYSQTGVNGFVVDQYSQEPLSGVLLTDKKGQTTYSDLSGYFDFALHEQASSDKKPEPDIIISNQTIYINVLEPFRFYLSDIKGNIILSSDSEAGVYSGCLPALNEAYYILCLTTDNKKFAYKIVKNRSQLFWNIAQSNIVISGSTDSLSLKKEGYHSTTLPINRTQFGVYQIKSRWDKNLSYLSSLLMPSDFTMLEGSPQNEAYSGVKSVKLLYNFIEDKIYYINSSKYMMHSEFAIGELGYKRGNNTFNIEQYVNHPNRKYFMTTITHFKETDKYVMDFYVGDGMNCNDIENFYNRIIETSYLQNNLYFLVNTPKWNNCTGIPTITSQELFGSLNYMALNKEEAYGYLLKVDINDIPTTDIGRNNIVLTNGVPLEIAVISGIITTQYQTPLSHINVLSHNRGTPNMMLRDAWNRPELNQFLNELVHFKVMSDTFLIEKADIAEANRFWAERHPQKTVYLKKDSQTKGLIDTENASYNDIKTIGGKAANFSELLNISAKGLGKIPTPEASFAIPFYYYEQHIKSAGLEEYCEQMLNNNDFNTNSKKRKTMLATLRDMIENSPLSQELLDLVNTKIFASGYERMRFRSSTNAEDIIGFNGAGLYDSYTGKRDGSKKTYERAIKKVWSSLWNFRAFEEREYFKIDHKTIAMGVLVHRSFPDEKANGVVITKNMFDKYNFGLTINVQYGEISVVNSEDNYLPETIVYSPYSIETNKGYTAEYVSYSNVPEAQGKSVLTTTEMENLSKYCLTIHNYYCRKINKSNNQCTPLDIEFKIDEVDNRRKIYIKQIRFY